MISAILVLFINVALIITTIVTLIRACVVPEVLRELLVNLNSSCWIVHCLGVNDPCHIVAIFLNFSADPPPNLILCRLLVCMGLHSLSYDPTALSACLFHCGSTHHDMVKYNKTAISPYCIVHACHHTFVDHWSS